MLQEKKNRLKLSFADRNSLQSVIQHLLGISIFREDFSKYQNF